MLFGSMPPPGKTETAEVKEIWQLDVDEGKWRQVPGGAGGPKGRHWHSTAAIAGEAIFLFGGFDGSSVLEDVWWFSKI